MSKLLTLNWADFIKGLIMAILGAVIGLIQATVDAHSLNFDWHKIGVYALLAAVSYLTKNLLSNSAGQFLKKEP